MAIDPEVISAIEAAVAADPDNSALRIHLGGLLLDAGRPAEALTHAETVLLDAPDDLGALGLAAEAGLLLDDARAPGWARLRCVERPGRQGTDPCVRRTDGW